MKLDKKLLVNGVFALVLVFVIYLVFQFTSVEFSEGNSVMLFLLFLIFLELERKNR